MFHRNDFVIIDNSPSSLSLSFSIFSSPSILISAILGERPTGFLSLFLMESVDLRRIKEALSIISTERNEKIGDDAYRDSFLHSFAKSLENSNDLLADLSPSTSLSLSSYNSDWNYNAEKNPTSENEGQSLSLPESFDDPIAETVAPPATVTICCSYHFNDFI